MMNSVFQNSAGLKNSDHDNLLHFKKMSKKLKKIGQNIAETREEAQKK
jgi:hypothetical protein